MAEGEDRGRIVRDAMEPAQGFFDLGMPNESWDALDALPVADRAHPFVMLLRLEILIALRRFDDAVALGTGACRQWPRQEGFFLKTVAALIELSDHEKARDLLLAAPSMLRDKAAYWYDLARCHCVLGEVDQSRRCLWECINRDKSYRGRSLDDPDLETVWRTL